MCPAVTVRNWMDYIPLLAVGSTTGNILIYNISTGHIYTQPGDFLLVPATPPPPPGYDTVMF
jgi:hypothetical protein